MILASNLCLCAIFQASSDVLTVMSVFPQLGCFYCSVKLKTWVKEKRHDPFKEEQYGRTDIAAMQIICAL